MPIDPARETVHARSRPLVAVVCTILRAAATALALATAAGVVLDVVRPGSAVHPHWIGTLGSAWADSIAAAAFSILVLVRRPIEHRWADGHRVLARGIAVLVAGPCAVALARHAHAIAVGRLAAVGFAPPLALVALAIVVAWAFDVARPLPDDRRRASRLASAAAVAGATAVLVLAQIAAVGSTDYRARADAILVLGSKVNADGRPSGSLVDRTRTACALWKAGYATTIVLSGGRGLAPVSEPEAIR